jgi:hypothetical protein
MAEQDQIYGYQINNKVQHGTELMFIQYILIKHRLTVKMVMNYIIPINLLLKEEAVAKHAEIKSEIVLKNKE